METTSRDKDLLVTSQELRARIGTAGVGLQFRAIAIHAKTYLGIEAAFGRENGKRIHTFTTQEADDLFLYGILRWYGKVRWPAAAEIVKDFSRATPQQVGAVRMHLDGWWVEQEKDRDRASELLAELELAATAAAA